MQSMHYHNPVLLQEAVAFLAVIHGSKYIDCTLGGGGHTAEIIRLGGIVLGLDQDPEALSACPDLQGLTKVRSNFSHLTEVAGRYGFSPVSGILIDLGLSQHQIDSSHRGFSFQKNGPLDMRMDPDLPHTAATLINQLSTNQLTRIFKDFGEIPVAKHLSQKIVSQRPLTTTQDLLKIAGKWSQQAFQALRMAVNDELGALNSVLPQAYELLSPSGRLVVISFHSLEDRIVKIEFKRLFEQKSVTLLNLKPLFGEKSAKLRAYVKN